MEDFKPTQTGRGLNIILLDLWDIIKCNYSEKPPNKIFVLSAILLPSESKKKSKKKKKCSIERRKWNEFII